MRSQNGILLIAIRNVARARGPDSGSLFVTWTASDKGGLSRQPITIAYATKPEGPWTPISGATNLENTGRFVWRMPEDVPFLFFIRVEATDEAGNVGKATWKEAVKADLSVPKARVIGADPVKP